MPISIHRKTPRHTLTYIPNTNSLSYKMHTESACSCELFDELVIVYRFDRYALLLLLPFAVLPLLKFICFRLMFDNQVQLGRAPTTH